MSAIDKNSPYHFIEENTGIFSGAYISPNEYSPHFYADIVQSSNETLISVGTFRSLIDFTMGSFEQAILIDNDGAACEFNRAHLDLIKDISSMADLTPLQQRQQYLAALHTHWLSQEQLNQNIELKHLFAQLEDEKRFQDFEQMPTNIQKSIVRIIELMGDKVNSDWLPNTVARKLNQLDHPAGFVGYYWENDAAWGRLVEAVHAGKIFIIQGDIAGSETLSSIGKELTLKGKQVSVVDISNVPEYFSEKTTDQFLKNLTSLPLSNQSQLLFTCSATYKKELPCAGCEDHGLGYGYYHLTKDQFGKLKNFIGRNLRSS